MFLFSDSFGAPDPPPFGFCPDGITPRDGSPDGGCPVDTPLDNNIIVLLAIGGIYGVMKIRQNKMGIQES